MKPYFTLLFLCASVGLFGQVNYTANDQITPYDGLFRPGVNPAFYPNWTSEQVADIAAGNSLFGVQGVGVKAFRTAIFESYVEQFGYDDLLPTYQYYDALGLKDNTCIVGFPSPAHQEQTEYCSGIQSEMFANLYTPIWDGGANGTPYNDDNYFAAYMYEIVVRYGDYIKFWEIWNEPGFDFTGNCGWREPGDPVCNWWDNNPDPCDYKLRAPIYSYVRTLRIAYDVIKTLNPDDYVVVAGVGFESFLDAILRNTDNPVDGSVTSEYPLGGGAYFDVMGFHSYPHFDGSTIMWDGTQFNFKRHSDGAADGIPFKQNIRQGILDNYGYDGNTYPKKEWNITEINIPRAPFTSANQGWQYVGSEEAQKNYIIKAIANAMIYDINQIHVFRLGEREYLNTTSGPNPEFDVMGLYQRLDDISPYDQIINIEGIAYKTASDCLFGSTYDATKTNQMNLPAGVRGGAFLQSNGEYVYVIWAETLTDLSEAASANYSFPGSFGFSNLYQKEWDYSQTQQSTQISASNIALTATPIFLTENEPVPPPVITVLCPADITVFADQNSNGEVVTFPNPDAATTCNSGLTMTQVGGPVSGSFFNIGTATIEFEATDDCGNVVLCNFDVIVNSPVGGCPDVINGFTFLGEYDGHKYFISENISRPQDAQIAAQTVGGHLAVINDQAENDFIQQNISDMVYIGLNDFDVEDAPAWVNGDPVNFTNFDICNFCNGNEDEMDFVVMHPWNGGWSWSNQFNQRLFVIELPCNTGGGSELTLTCPSDQSLTTSAPGATVTVNWNPPSASTTCTGGNVNLTQTGGIANGSDVGAGTYQISYEATDDCGNVQNCNFIVTVTDGGGGGGCPGDIAGFTALGEFNGHKYYISNDPARPVDAQNNALANDGYLAVINDQAENDFIQQNISQMVYIGLNDFDTEGDLVWVNGDPLSYDNINPCGFCEANSDEQDFVVMQPWDGAWSFSNFWNQRLYIMEVDCDGGGGCPCPAIYDPVCGSDGVTYDNDCEAECAGIFTYTPGECSTGGCPDDLPGYTYLGEFGGSAYFLSDDIARAEDAEIAAQSVGGHLATINSQAENDFLYPQISGVVYIGLNDAMAEGSEEWFSGEAVGYTNFDICSFCNANEAEMDYVIMHSWNGGWSWSNFFNSRQYIVEVPCSSPLMNPDNTLITLNGNAATATKKPALEAVMPNPATDEIFVKIKSQTEETVDLQIFDARGSVVRTVPIELYNGLVFKRLNISDLPSGLYYMMIPQGQRKQGWMKFVKQRL